MLSIDTISNNREETLIGLKKRGFKDLKIIDKIIDLNISRKKVQQELDQILFESNNISKKISENLLEDFLSIMMLALICVLIGPRKKLRIISLTKSLKRY